MYKFCKLWLFGVISGTLLLSSCTYVEPYILDFYNWFGLLPDNQAEEVIEEVIEWKTGVSTDLTPSSPE